MSLKFVNTEKIDVLSKNFHAFVVYICSNKIPL